MRDFDEMCKRVEEVVSEFTETPLRVESDPESHVVRISGRGFTPLARARNGLEDVDELAVMTAEHHPYWNLLYNCCQICRILLDRWESKLTKEEADEIRWSADMLSDMCKKMCKT